MLTKTKFALVPTCRLNGRLCYKDVSERDRKAMGIDANSSERHSHRANRTEADSSLSRYIALNFYLFFHLHVEPNETTIGRPEILIFSLMSGIERKYCLISSLHLAG